MERTIRVTGKGKLSVKPDMIRLRINIEGMYEEYDETLRKSSDCVEILKDLIEKLGYVHIAKLIGRVCGAKWPHSVSKQPISTVFE